MSLITHCFLLLKYELSSRLFGNYRPPLIHLPIDPVGLVGDPLTVCILAETLLYSIFVLSNVLGDHPVIFIRPLALASPMHPSLLPIALVFVVFALK